RAAGLLDPEPKPEALPTASQEGSDSFGGGRCQRNGHGPVLEILRQRVSIATLRIAVRAATVKAPRHAVCAWVHGQRRSGRSYGSAPFLHGPFFVVLVLESRVRPRPLQPPNGIFEHEHAPPLLRRYLEHV